MPVVGKFLNSDERTLIALHAVRTRGVLLTLAAAVALSACSPASTDSGDSTANSRPIAIYCPYLPSRTNFLSPITVSGTAKYEYRTNGNGAVAATPRPIRYAEVEVRDSDGVIIQCAETDTNGEFSFQLPGDGKTYSVAVVSRANNSSNTAYILDTPSTNVAYKVSQSVTASGSPSVQLLAKATGDLKGGAFNILDQVLNAQNYLRTKTAGCGSVFGGCQAFTTAPIVYTYWAPGVNPGSYYGISGGLSFYLNGVDKLFILGGLNGDFENSDMDHFDNSVIVHEYAHFIEDNFGKPDSPGGSHNGNSIIDPRLAWGEGWANFFQGAVLYWAGLSTTEGPYRDTYGHTGCTGSNPQGYPGCTGVLFNVGLSTQSTDIPIEDGEGEFREFSVARTLFASATADTNNFAEIWTVLNGTADSMRVINDSFKAAGRFHTIQQLVTGALDWSSYRSSEKQPANRANYATPIKTAGCAGNTASMAIKKVSGDDGSFAKSHLLLNNDFYVYSHSGGALNVDLSWSGAGKANLDLYVYKPDYVYGEYTTMVTYAETYTTTTNGSESVSATPEAGLYLINIMADPRIYSSNGTYNTTYTLSINGTIYCPNL